MRLTRIAGRFVRGNSGWLCIAAILIVAAACFGDGALARNLVLAACVGFALFGTERPDTWSKVAVCAGRGFVSTWVVFGCAVALAPFVRSDAEVRQMPYGRSGAGVAIAILLLGPAVGVFGAFVSGLVASCWMLLSRWKRRFDRI